MAIHFNNTYLKGFLAEHELDALSGAVKTIGGSYLGARAAIELLKSPLYNNLKKDTPDIYFAGNSVSPSYLQELLSICEGKDLAVNVISKSGTTTEPALAFRVFKSLLEKKYGAEGAKERIYCTTDKAKGTLKELADREGYATFVVPDDVGGRYSVLTAVGLLPIAAAGCDIQKMMDGAKAAQEAYDCGDLEKNECYQYAATRFALSQKGKSVEIMASFEPCFGMMAEWYKQLFGESDGWFISSKKPVQFPATCWGSIPLISPVWKVIKRICLPCWASPVMKTAAPIWKHGFPNNSVIWTRYPGGRKRTPQGILA